MEFAADFLPVASDFERQVADRVAGAMQELNKQIYSHGERMEGLANRRRAESQLFLFGIYA